MIKFFRKIRQRLLSENRFSKYLLYAIGEIILVMIGILLALQVSSWNQQRVDRNKEQLLLSALHDEFVANRTQLDTVVSYHRKALGATEYMIAQFPIDTMTLNLDTLSKYTFGWGYRFTFDPSQGIVRSLVNTSSFEIISNQELRSLLISWEDVLADYQEEELIASESMNKNYGPKFLSKFSWNGFTDKRIDKWFMTSLEFENMYYSRQNDLQDIFGQVAGVGELEIIQQTIDRIIELSSLEEY